MWLIQVMAVLLQVGYLMVVSRSIDASGFAPYGVAVLVVTLGNLIAQQGISQAAARRLSGDVQGDRQLISVAILLGVGCALTTIVLAPALAWAWGAKDSAWFIVALSLGMPALAISGVQSGVLRRRSRIRALALCTIAAVLVSLVVGAAVTYASSDPRALAIAPVLNPWMAVVLMGTALGGDAVPSRIKRSALADVHFTARSTTVGLATYVTYSLPQWVTSIVLGPTTFGNWNRAVAVGQVPVETLSRSVNTVLFSRFRAEGSPDERTREYWTRVLCALALLIIPMTMLATPVVPQATRLVLGPGWVVASWMTPWVFASAMISVFAAVLVMALEARASFRVIWIGQVLGFAIMLAAAILVWTTSSWLPLVAGLGAAILGVHLVQVHLSGRIGLLDSDRVFRRYAVCTLAGCLLMAESAAVTALSRSGWAAVINVLLLVAAGGGVLWYRRRALRLLPSDW
jgi:O-antigen/teichoic acid export membrane protein